MLINLVMSQGVTVMKENVIRFNPDPLIGLTEKEVEKRIQNGLQHRDENVKTKTNKEIIYDNVFTLFNMLNFGLAFAILLVGAFKNLLFIGTIIMNMIISTYQALKAKKTVDKLALLNETKIEVIRASKTVKLAREELVLDDVMVLRIGNQVVVDSVIIEGECQVNESFITGEDNPIIKKNGDTILSGSFIITGLCKAKVEHIGADNYTSKISSGAKYIKNINSEIMGSMNKVIKIISLVIVPLGILLFLNQLQIDDNTFTEAVIKTVAALVGMIPDGLMLLTSTVLAISVVKLGKYQVLVQELYCIETLARVDVLCLDKTGTITEGSMEIQDIIYEPSTDENEVKQIINNLCWTLNDISPTMGAIKTRFQNESGTAFKAKKIELFSSENKYSKVELADVTYFLGAPDFIIKNNKNDYHEYEKENRVILVAKEENKKRTPLAIILIQDKIRDSAKKTLAYFKAQGVTIKIISGDNPLTVSQIAKKVELDDYDKYIDFSTVTTKEEMERAYLENAIFGRVKPEQKKDLITLIKSLGHTVAMTGDGINDVLALKEADCSIAMASGSDAARNVSQLVLLNSNFDSMPKVVEEGRQTINNIQRSASLFLTKTIYTTLMVIGTLFLSLSYPFLPIHLSLMNLITIAIPSFVLALEPNNDLVKGRFLTNVIFKALPTALTVFSAIIVMMILGSELSLEPEMISTMAVVVCTIIHFSLLYKISKPFNWIRKTLFVIVNFIFIFELLFLGEFFSLTRLNHLGVILVVVTLLATFTLFKGFHFLANATVEFYKKLKRAKEAFEE